MTAAVYDSVTTQVAVGELKLYLLCEALRNLSGPTGKDAQQDPGCQTVQLHKLRASVSPPASVQHVAHESNCRLASTSVNHIDQNCRK